MSPIIFDGRLFAKEGEEKLRRAVLNLGKRGIKPKLVTILIGDNPGSVLYVNLKKKAAERIGAIAEVITLRSDIDEVGLRGIIKKYNFESSVHGIMVQLPLPTGLKDKTKEILNEIDSQKDIDGLRINSTFVPATVKAILMILEDAFRDLNIDKNKREKKIKKVVVVGSSGMVGAALVKLLAKLEYPVRGIDIETKEISEITKNADILVSATGVVGLVDVDMVKEGTIVIDVGSPYGDVDFENVSKKASFITPVPGGIGPVTILSLLDNLIISTGAVSVLQD
ncbi:bifunctional 5,10-methylenetetrahydrofolate dehydrogenase/5,10-methenyltetrahydrofolate cyclohydrolase [Candidatus Woesebacteria bacterium]|nr:bifunctional 5,10-methylenetetrahydrofolate dehydrogenase/5,10-methenyltetrahydrofolate cyclohydrolase [Candidatus Woesebacteria bacterium]